MDKPATSKPDPQPADEGSVAQDRQGAEASRPRKPKEIGGPSGPEPTRYGDWEQNGRCTDF